MGGLLGVSQAGFRSGRISGLTVWVLQGAGGRGLGAGMARSSPWPGAEGRPSGLLYPSQLASGFPFYLFPALR